MKTFLKIIIAIFFFSILTACQQESGRTKIGVIVPLEHKALEEIVAGFYEKLRAIYHEPVQIKVMNAQGDANLQRAIIQQMQDQNYKLIVPIATGVTQMTASMVRNKPIISLAADFSEKDRKKLTPCNIAVVHDEISTQELLGFLHLAYPNLKHLTLIHSASDKIFPDVKEAIAYGKKNNMEIKPLMVATLPELISATQALSTETQGIFILKDNLIASGIATLIKTAQEKHIPLFTSDQGTVEAGAGFSLGVHERSIGEEGAILAVNVLNGKNICDLPIVEMKKLTVFINKKALQLTKQDPTSIENAAKKLSYSIEFAG